MWLDLGPRLQDSALVLTRDNFPGIDSQGSVSRYGVWVCQPEQTKLKKDPVRVSSFNDRYRAIDHLSTPWLMLTSSIMNN